MIIKKVNLKPMEDRGWVITRTELHSANIWFCNFQLQWRMTPQYMSESTCDSLYKVLTTVYDLKE